MKIARLLLLLTAALVAGFWLGRNVRSSQPSQAMQPTHASIREDTPSTIPAPTIDCVQPLRELFAQNGPHREADLRLALAHASEAEFQTALKNLQGGTPSLQRDRDLRLLFELWGQRDPQGALAYAEQNFDARVRDVITDGVLAGWVTQDPDAAFAWANAPGRDSRLALSAVESLAQTDPRRALLFISQLTGRDESFLQRAYESIVESPAKAGRYDEARQLIETIPDPSRREQMAVQLSFLWARYQPQEAARWAMTMSENDERTQIMANIASEWGARDPQAAANFAAALPPGPTKQQALVNTMIAWGNSNVADASAWLNQFDPNPDNDPSVATIATTPRLVEHNPSIALSWAESIFGAEARADAIRQITEQWAQRDLPAARHYLENSTALTVEQRTALIARLSNPRPPASSE